MSESEPSLRRRREPPADPRGESADTRMPAAQERADATAVPVPLIEPASPDVTIGLEASALPGEHRGGFARELTAPLDVALVPHAEPEPEPDPDWTPSATIPTRRRPPSLPAWALGLAVVALAGSIFVVWALPVAVAAIVVAILALRRTGSRAIAVWALALGTVAAVYSTGWLVWGIPRLPGILS